MLIKTQDMQDMLAPLLLQMSQLFNIGEEETTPIPTPKGNANIAAAAEKRRSANPTDTSIKKTYQSMEREYK